MLELIGAAALEILNIALSIVSLATRFVASILNFGYVSTSVKLRSEYLLFGAEIDGRNEERHKRVECVLDANYSEAQKYDLEAHEAACKLI